MSWNVFLHLMGGWLLLANLAAIQGWFLFLTNSFRAHRRVQQPSLRRWMSDDPMVIRFGPSQLPIKVACKGIKGFIGKKKKKLEKLTLSFLSSAPCWLSESWTFYGHWQLGWSVQVNAPQHVATAQEDLQEHLRAAKGRLLRSALKIYCDWRETISPL